MISIEFTKKGPFFNANQVEATFAALSDEIRTELAQETLDFLINALKGDFKHPTGRYISNLAIMDTEAATMITDNGVVYGPWLEGVSSRNARSRFKGYAEFRKAAAMAENKAAALADSVAAKYVGRLS